MTTTRIAVLASGGGSNFESLAAHLDALGAARPAEIALVASDKATAGALNRAKDRGIETRVIDPADGGATLERALHSVGAELVVLAGYLKLVPANIARVFRGRIMNVHPALLPQFGGSGMYGAHVHQAVLASRAQETGPTVHFVDEMYDHGPIIAQWRVPVLSGDDVPTLAARVLRAEHLLYPRAVAAVARGTVTLDAEGRVHGVRAAPPVNAALDPSAVARAMDALFA